MPKIEDDPVYNQPKNITTPTTRSDPGIADDPTYNQPKGKSSGSKEPDPPANNNTSRRFLHRDGKGEVTEDPTYDQPKQTEDKTPSVSDDPTYSRPKGNSSDDEEPLPPVTYDGTSPRARHRDGKGEVTEDPTYNQPKPNGDKGTQSISDDPTYSRPERPQSTPGNDRKAETRPDSTESESTTRAKSRLNQLTSQLTPPQSEPPSHQANTQKPRSRKSKSKSKSKPKDPQSLLPNDYTDITNSIDKMHDHALNPPQDHRGYTRQLQSGKLTARQRIATLLNPGTFRELGSLTGTTKWSVSPENPLVENVEDFTPSNNPQGFGQVTCLHTGTDTMKRQVYLTADDFAIRGGHADGHNGLKTLYGEKLALRLKVPVIKLTDGSSGGGSVSTIATQGWSYIPHVSILGPVMKQLNAGIPNMGAVVGPAIGLGAARVVSTHFSVMASDVGSLFNAGPKVVEGATFEEGLTFSELGGPGVHCCNGTIDNMARDEKECYEQIRTVLGYLPDCGALQAPPCLGEGWSGDSVEREDEGLRSVIPRRKSRMYNPYTIIESVVDRDSWFEIGALWGRTGIVGLARLGGRPVAILSNNCEVNGGALDAGGSQKLMKMIKFADVFNLPIVQFVDVPGYAIGTVAERTGVMKWGVELGKAYYTSTVPIFSVLTRRAYGVAGGIMLDSREPWMRISWPSANWGSLPLDGGIEVGHRHELRTIREKAEKERPGSGEEAFRKRYQELEEMYMRLMNPVRTANVFNVEEIVDPKDTRKICCRWTREMYGVVMQERLADRAAGKIVPVFS